MGINKPNVRWVIHHDLPKNLEAYYQETGRAGRDGLPADCLLLFSAGDAAKQAHFINGMSTPQEQRVARRQLREMISLLGILRLPEARTPCLLRRAIRHAVRCMRQLPRTTRQLRRDNCLPKVPLLRLSYPGSEPARARE